ncbi:MAG TPA: hypothetical protein VFN25_06055 [Dokdonella sp.]|uniref:hypothetical protein n=1 Tax=Dokdonella sp. TaxID=2291710 RepID=UPI002D7F4430|nr:hypothetical protein [Dokdonella sp.]HET9032450.1 hypothetical protein [Dokdonella sp.]
MSLKIVLVFAVALMSAPLVHAAEFDQSKFESVLPSEYFNMLRDAAVAYGAKDYDKAFRLFQRTACAGDKQSQSALGRMYLLGQGTKRDDLTGYAWLKIAAEFIFPKYQSVVRGLEQAMTPEQRKIADAKAAELIARYSIGETNMSCNLSASKGGHIMDQITCTPQYQGRLMMLKRCEAPAAD